MNAELETMKNDDNFEFIKQNFGFCYVFNVFKILRVSKKYFDFANSKYHPIWRNKCTNITKFLIQSVFTARCHFSNSHHEEVNNNG